MARQRDPRREEAFQIWKESNGSIKLKDIAERLDVADTQIRKWKSQDKWEPSKGNVTNSKRNVTKEKKEEEVVKADGLNEKQQLFCIYYIKYFNATKAYQKAYACDYVTAMASGSRLLRNVKVSAEIDRLKEEQTTALKIDAQVVLQKYIDIALADISDFVTFGQKEQQVMTMYGPLFEKNKHGKVDKSKPVMETVNYIDFKESGEIDGTIVTEVKQGRDGVSVKLADKMKALEMLTKYTDMLSDNERKRLLEEKIKVEIVKGNAEIEKLTSKDDDDAQKDVAAALRGLVDGLNAKAD